MKRNFNFSVAAILILTFSSCISDKKMSLNDFETAPLQGMIYTSGNEPCSGVRIMIDDLEDVIISDINGRFVLYELSQGLHTLKSEKKDYETLNIKIDFFDKNQILYLKMSSYNFLLQELEEALSSLEYRSMETLFQRLESIRTEDPVAQYMKSIYLLRTGHPQKALNLLQRLTESGFRNQYVEKTIENIHTFEMMDL